MRYQRLRITSLRTDIKSFTFTLKVYNNYGINKIKKFNN